MATKDDGSEVLSAEARDRFSELLGRAAFGGERIILTRRGRGSAALVPLEVLELIETLEDRIGPGPPGMKGRGVADSSGRRRSG